MVSTTSLLRNILKKINRENIDLSTQNSFSITELIVQMSCGIFDEKQQEWQHFPMFFEQAAEADLLEMETSIVVPVLINYYLNNFKGRNDCKWRIQWRIAEILSQIDFSNPQLLNILEDLIVNCKIFEIVMLAYRILVELEIEIVDEHSIFSQKIKELYTQINQIMANHIITVCNNFNDRGLNFTSTEVIPP